MKMPDSTYDINDYVKMKNTHIGKIVAVKVEKTKSHLSGEWIETYDILFGSQTHSCVNFNDIQCKVKVEEIVK